MKIRFFEYYRPTESGFKDLWNSCLFILDANILLNLYRYSLKTTESLMNVLEFLKDRIWIPHQAALEFHKHRYEEIYKQEKVYDQIIKLIDDNKKNITSKIKEYKRHPTIKFNDVLNIIESNFSDINKEIENFKSKHPNLFKEDNILLRLTKLFEEKVGNPYGLKELEKIYEEAKIRYASKIPPGFKDMNNKSEPEMYNDVVIWYQIIDKAKELKKPIIFITDDRKEDWWYIPVAEKTVGPRVELIREIYEKANCKFYMYNFGQFMKYVKNFLGIEVEKDAATEVDEVRVIDIEQDELLQKINKQVLLRKNYISELEEIIGKLNILKNRRTVLKLRIKDLAENFEKKSYQMAKLLDQKGKMPFYNEKEVEDMTDEIENIKNLRTSSAVELVEVESEIADWEERVSMLNMQINIINEYVHGK